MSLSDLMLGLVLYVGIVVMCALLSGCVSMGPSDWRPESHMTMMKVCRVACHPGRVQSYEPIDGACKCTAR